jgi:hypothetical protein
MHEFFFCLLVLLTGINLVLGISTSMVLIKLYEMSRNQEERHEMVEEARRQARGLIEVDRPGAPFVLKPQQKQLDNR